MSPNIEARDHLRKVTKPVLTEELAERVYALTRTMQDSTPVGPLGAKWNGMMSYRSRQNNMNEPPAREWTAFMESLQPLERTHLCMLLDHAMVRIQAITVGDLREFAQTKGHFIGIGVRGKSFLDIAFRRDETDS